MDPDTLEPVRPWPELVALSTARGRVLRRRRRALHSAPVVMVVAVAFAFATAGGDLGRAGLDRLKMTNQQPAHSHTRTPRSGTPQAPARPDRRQTPPLFSTGSGAAASTTAGIPSPGARGSTRERTAKTGGPTVVPQVLAFSDPTGDATAQGASANALSDPSLDITGMRFETTSAGLRVSMSLASSYRSNGLYLAYLTDERTGWQIQLSLGGSPKDYAYVVQWSAGGATVVSSQFLPLPDTPDRSPTQLVAQIPWSYFPSVVDPHDRFNSISGQTRLLTATNQGLVADNAPTTKTFGPMLR